MSNSWAERPLLFSIWEVERVVTWASLECEKQRSGERSVGRMVEAWSYAMQMSKLVPASDMIRDLSTHIIRLGSVVEPRVNRGSGWREVHVTVGFSRPPDWREVPRLMDQLCEAWMRLEPDEWYKEFEEIHPFADGNGRVGNILWNLRRGSLHPQALAFPPDYWGNPSMNMPTESINVFSVNPEEE